MLADQQAVSEIRALTTASLDGDPHPDIILGGEYDYFNFDSDSDLPAPLGGVSWLKKVAEDEEPTPTIELVSFTATVEGEAIRLQWETLSETDSLRFDVERSIDGSVFQDIGQVDGTETTSSPRHYALTDESLPYVATTATYRLRLVGDHGVNNLSTTVQVELSPEAISLEALFPNPAQSSTTLRFAVPEPTDVEVSIYNAVGQLVARPFHEPQVDGRREIMVSTDRLSSGVYFIRLDAGNETWTQRLTVVR